MGHGRLLVEARPEAEQKLPCSTLESTRSVRKGIRSDKHSEECRDILFAPTLAQCFLTSCRLLHSLYDRKRRVNRIDLVPSYEPNEQKERQA